MCTRRLSMVLFVLMLAAHTAHAAGRCDDTQGQSVAALQARVDSLNRSLGQSEGAASGQSDAASIRGTQEQLLTATEQLECLQSNAVAVEKGILSTSTFVEVPLLFVTDRQRAPSSQVDLYGPNPSNDLEFGKVKAVIDEIGGIRTSLIAGARRVPAPKSMGKSQVQGMQQVTEKNFVDLLSSAGAKRDHNPVRVLLFVHGFNVQFYEAGISTARLATSMQLPLIPVFYSWPSQGAVKGYWRDEDTVSTSVVRFTPFLSRLLSGPADEVVIVCHSMGARVVTRALGELARNHANLPGLKKVVFAAADLDAQEFTAQLPSLRQIPNVGITLYEASDDLALRLSKFIHQFRRLGESDGGVYLADGVDTIDASSTTSVFHAAGHSYIVGSPALAADISDWVSQDLPPPVRGLQRAQQGTTTYYRFP
jgi:esterase/lipase superfamily enzyme